jgi:hypothetical protein
MSHVESITTSNTQLGWQISRLGKVLVHASDHGPRRTPDHIALRARARGTVKMWAGVLGQGVGDDNEHSQ